MDKEYVPIADSAQFCNLSISLAQGEDSEKLKNSLHGTLQGISGTGSLKIAAAFLANLFPGNIEVYLPTPSRSNLTLIYKLSGLSVQQQTCGFDSQGTVQDIPKIPEKSITLFHARAHNPTGADPKPEQCVEMSKVVQQKKLFPFFNVIY